MAEQDKGNVTSNLTASDANKVQTTKKPSAKLKSSTVKDVISKGRTMTGSKPDEININPIQELNQAFREAVNDENPNPKYREAVPRSGQDPKKKMLVPRGDGDRKDCDRPYRHQSIVKKIVDEDVTTIKEAFEELNKSFEDLVEDAFDMEGFIEEDFEPTGMELYEDWGEPLEEAEKDGRRVKLGKPFLTPGGPKKRAVYVKNEKGSVVKVNFGDPNMTIKKSDPERRKSFRARHNCENPGPRTKARYWSCKAW